MEGTLYVLLPDGVFYFVTTGWILASDLVRIQLINQNQVALSKENLNASKPSEQSKVLGRSIKIFLSTKPKNTTRYVFRSTVYMD